MTGLTRRHCIALFCGLYAIVACQRGAGDRIDKSGTVATPISSDSVRFVDHPDFLPVGFPSRIEALLVKNPYEGDKRAIEVGSQLFIGYNCIDCHGAEGSGAMGPSFQDGRWHFGGSPAELFESIYQGRPDGMPAWGGRISNDQIWMLTAYLRSLPSKDLTTENFTGRTVERSGH